MPEKEPQFFKPEAAQKETPERKVEIKEKPVEELKGFIKEMSLGLENEGIPVDEKARINVDEFTGVYHQRSIEADKEWIKDLKGRWERAAIVESRWSWAFPKGKALRDQPVGEVLEMLATAVLHKNLGKDFVVARTSEYDDVRNKVDNIILDRKTGNIICAFDDIGTVSGKRFEEKQQKILERNWLRGGADLKYGISFQESKGKMELEKGLICHIPLFYLALSEEEIKKALENPVKEKKIFNDFIGSAKEQAEQIKKEPLHPKLKQRLDFFGKVIEKF